jgi:hypothetical protein
MADVYLDGEVVGTAEIPTAQAPALAIPTEVWYTIGGVSIIAIVGALIWMATRRR